MTRPIIDRTAAKERILARYRDEAAHLPGMVAMRCTDHGRFILWVHPPLPPARVACPPECAGE